MSKTPEKAASHKLRVRSSKPAKLKDKVGRQYITINLESFFGFMPDTIIVEKVSGVHDTVVVNAVLTDAEIKRVEEENKNKLDTITNQPEQHKGFQIKDLPPKTI